MSGPRTLMDVLDTFEADGFVGQFRARPGGVVECNACEGSCPAQDLEIVAYERLEGASDPADMMLVVAAACRACGERGTLVLSYGPMASADDAGVEAKLRLE